MQSGENTVLDVGRLSESRVDLLAFTEEMFRARKGADFILNWHHVEICNALEKVMIGETKRLIINVPPKNANGIDPIKKGNNNLKL